MLVNVYTFLTISNSNKKHHKFDACNFNFSCIKDPQKF